jgi:hypothetical protein
MLACVELVWWGCVRPKHGAAAHRRAAETKVKSVRIGDRDLEFMR